MLLHYGNIISFLLNVITLFLFLLNFITVPYFFTMLLQPPFPYYWMLLQSPFPYYECCYSPSFFTIECCYSHLFLCYWILLQSLISLLSNVITNLHDFLFFLHILSGESQLHRLGHRKNSRRADLFSPFLPWSRLSQLPDCNPFTPRAHQLPQSQESSSQLSLSRLSTESSTSQSYQGSSILLPLQRTPLSMKQISTLLTALSSGLPTLLPWRWIVKLWKETFSLPQNPTCPIIARPQVRW